MAPLMADFAGSLGTVKPSGPAFLDARQSRGNGPSGVPVTPGDAEQRASFGVCAGGFFWRLGSILVFEVLMTDLSMNETTEVNAGDHVMTSGKFEGARVRDIANHDELVLQAISGAWCARDDRGALRDFIHQKRRERRRKRDSDRALRSGLTGFTGYRAGG